MLSNIWQHPKTSIAGLLIGIVTIAGVLSQQGITLGSAGTGTVVTLLAGIATAILGLLAKDPGSVTVPASSSSTQKLGAVMLIALLTMSTLTTGCTSAQTLADLANTLGTAASSIAAFESNAALAAKIKTDTGVAVSQILSWKSGSSAGDAIEAINLLEDDLDLIPANPEIDGLVTLALGTIEGLISDLGGQGAVLPTAATPHAAVARKHPSALPYGAPKTLRQFKSRWNAIIKANPELAAQKL